MMDDVVQKPQSKDGCKGRNNNEEIKIPTF